MSAFPVVLAPQGGPATSGVNSYGNLDISSPIITVGNPSLDVLESLNSLSQTVDNQNYRVASQFIPVAKQAIATSPQVGNVGVVSNGGNNQTLYIGLGIAAIAAVAIFILLR